jgi:hypothetical protein
MWRAAVTTALLAALAFIGMLAWEQPDSTLQRVGHQVTTQIWLPLALIALLLVAYEKFLRRRLATEVAKIAAPSIIGAMPPQQVMESFLGSIYGANEANRDVIAGVLGGNLIVSAHTEVQLHLTAMTQDVYRFTLTTTYRFRQNVAADRFVVFVTCDTRLRDSITYLCDFPLFDLWFVPDQEFFLDSVNSLTTSAEVGMDYLDRDGGMHSTSFRDLPLTEVRYQEWSRYLPLFREAVGPFQRQHTHDYLGSLRIFDCALTEMTQERIRSIQRLSVRQSMLQKVDEPYCYWQPPYPCYVEQVDIDVSDFGFTDSEQWQFSVMPFSFRAASVATTWLRAAELTSIDLRSWLLPGHGVVVVWRPAGEL